MIQNIYKSSRYVLAAGALVSALFLLILPSTASATVTYQYVRTNLGTSTSMRSDILHSQYYPYGIDGIQFDFNDFLGFTSLYNVNFIDFEMFITATSTDEYVVVACYNLNTYGGCDGDTVIATSSSFSTSEMNNGWNRFYFDEAWSASFTTGQKLNFVIVPLLSTPLDSRWKFLTTYLDTSIVDGLRFGYTGYTGGIGWYYVTSHEDRKVRIGYDDLQDTTYYNGTLFVPSLTECSFGVFPSFDLSANDLLTYDNFWAEYTYTITYSDGQQTYGQTIGLTNGEGGSVFDCTDEDTGAIVAVTSGTLVGEIESTATIVDLMSLSTISGFKVGTTSLNLTDTLYGIDPFYIINPNDPFSENATSTNMEECRFGGNWARCFFGLIVPSTEQMQDSISRATSTIFVIPPLSWIISVGTILVQPLDSHATGTLPNLNITIPEGVPGAGTGIDLTPWNHLKNFWESEWNNNDIYEFETSSTTGEIIEPKINEIAKYMFALWLFGLLLVIRL